MPVLLKHICLIAVSMASVMSLTAQRGDIAKGNPPFPHRVIATEKSAASHALNIRAVRHFTITYPEAINESWSVNRDCYRVKFVKDSILYRVDYTRKGEWRNTCRQFDESKMPENIRTMIKSTFYDYTIVTVTELTYQKKISYFVKIEDEHTLKTIRVMEGEMEIVEAYKKR